MSADLIQAVYSALGKLDGDDLLAVALVTGFSLDEIRDLGGIA